MPKNLFVHQAQVNDLRYLYNQVKNDDGIVAPKRLLAHLANRSRLYPLVYVMRGQQQLSEKPYTVNVPLDSLIIDQEELLSRLFYWKDSQPYALDYSISALHISNLINEKGLRSVWSRDGFALFRPVSPEKSIDLIKSAPNNQSASNSSKIIAPGIRAAANLSRQHNGTAALTINWYIDENITTAYFVKIDITNVNGKEILSHRFDPGWGIASTNTWRAGSSLTSKFNLSWPKDGKQIQLALSPHKSDIDQGRDELPATITQHLIVPLTDSDKSR